MGFMIGHDSTWLPKALQVLHDELPNIHVVISTQNSPQLAAALSQGLIDVAFLRREDGGPGLEFRLLVEEPFEVFLSKEHPLAAQSRIGVEDIVGQTFLSVSGTALSISGKPPALRVAIDRFLKEHGVTVRPSHEVDNLGGMMSLITSTRGVALLPVYAKTFLPDSVTTRPLRGATPTIDVSIGYRRANVSEILKQFLSRSEHLHSNVAAARSATAGIQTF
jgi:LysR family hca operon transcriptional activator